MYPLTAYSAPVVTFRKFVPLPDGRLYSVVAYFRSASGYRQAKPYNVVTNYTMIEQTLISGVENANAWSESPKDNVSWTIATNKARSDFIGKLGDSAQFGSTATTERRATWSTIVTIITRIGKAARHVKRLELFDAAKTLGLPYEEQTKKIFRKRNEFISRRNGYGKIRVKRRAEFSRTTFSFGSGKQYSKSAASGWLMFSYGVKPLMQDIQTGMKTLTSEIPAQLVRASGRGEYKRIVKDGSTTYTTNYVTRVKVQAYVMVTNPNLWLANQLGLINPVQWINEGIPFSFVVDWFSNLSQIINQMTDFEGLSITNPCTITKGTIIDTRTGANPYSKSNVLFVRAPSVPTAKLLFAYERFQWQRGLNAISLLVGFLPSKRKM